MNVVKVVENEDGSANIELDMTQEEQALLVEYAVLDILKKEIEKNIGE